MWKEEGEPNGPASGRGRRFASTLASLTQRTYTSSSGWCWDPRGGGGGPKTLLPLVSDRLSCGGGCPWTAAGVHRQYLCI